MGGKGTQIPRKQDACKTCKVQIEKQKLKCQKTIGEISKDQIIEGKVHGGSNSWWGWLVGANHCRMCGAFGLRARWGLRLCQPGGEVPVRVVVPAHGSAELSDPTLQVVPGGP